MPLCSVELRGFESHLARLTPRHVTTVGTEAGNWRDGLRARGLIWTITTSPLWRCMGLINYFKHSLRTQGVNFTRPGSQDNKQSRNAT